MLQKDVSKATLGRFPMYLDFLEQLTPEVNRVSATMIAKSLGLGDVQVRKDLAQLSCTGKPKTGYVREELINAIKEFLFQDNVSAVIIGAGKLGTALFEYGGFEGYGIDILAAFDNKVSDIVVFKSGKKIYPMKKLAEFCKENDVKIGIITVPEKAAQQTLDLLCENNINNIWSFAPCKLKVPQGVNIKYENLALSLAHLKYQIH